MKYLVTGKEMQLLDKNTSEHFGVPSAVLMEQAAMVFVRELLLSVPDLKKVLVVAGLGNNGADGIAIARLLNQKNIHTELYTMQERLPEKKGSELFELQKKIYRNYGYPELNTDRINPAPEVLHSNLEGMKSEGCSMSSGAKAANSMSFDCVIDALFGIGLSRDITGVYAETVEWINALPGIKAAVDIVSGISADTGAVLGCAVRCDHTITFSFGKTGMYLWPGNEYSGDVHVVPMGITRESLPEGASFRYFSPEETDLPVLLPKRIPHSNKGTYGKLLVIAGGPGMAGACVFSAKAAYRTGTGLVSVFTHEVNRTVVQSLIPEAVLHTWDESMDDEQFRQKLLRLIGWADAIVIGPGLSLSAHAVLMVKTVLAAGVSIPVIADADALNILSQHPEILQERDAGLRNAGAGSPENKDIQLQNSETGSTESKDIQLQNPGTGSTESKETIRKPSLIITPHLGEMSRLTGRKIKELQTHLPDEAQSFAKKHNCICVLKDFHTVTAVPDGRIWINLSGNNGMATGGSGDVLSGIIGGLLAQGTSPEVAAYMGVYLHGCAGDRIASEKGQRSMMAGDIIDGITIASRSF